MNRKEEKTKKTYERRKQTNETKAIYRARWTLFVNVLIYIWWFDENSNPSTFNSMHIQTDECVCFVCCCFFLSVALSWISHLKCSLTCALRCVVYSQSAKKKKICVLEAPSCQLLLWASSIQNILTSSILDDAKSKDINYFPKSKHFHFNF